MATKKPTYQELRAELDEILERIRAGELDIEAATKAYEQAAVIVKKLETYLDAIEAKIEKVKPKA